MNAKKYLKKLLGIGTVYKPRRQRRGRVVVKMSMVSMFVYEGEGEGQGSVDKTDYTYQFQRILIVKYQFLQGLLIFLQIQS